MKNWIDSEVQEFIYNHGRNPFRGLRGPVESMPELALNEMYSIQIINGPIKTILIGSRESDA